MGSGKTGLVQNISKSEGITTEEITRALHFLNTTGMAPCGYVIYLWDEDHAIVNGGFIGWESSSSAGFCLELPLV
jgi:hypothetical protein